MISSAHRCIHLSCGRPYLLKISQKEVRITVQHRAHYIVGFPQERAKRSFEIIKVKGFFLISPQCSVKIETVIVFR